MKQAAFKLLALFAAGTMLAGCYCKTCSTECPVDYSDRNIVAKAKTPEQEKKEAEEAAKREQAAKEKAAAEKKTADARKAQQKPTAKAVTKKPAARVTAQKKVKPKTKKIIHQLTKHRQATKNTKAPVNNRAASKVVKDKLALSDEFNLPEVPSAGLHI